MYIDIGIFFVRLLYRLIHVMQPLVVVIVDLSVCRKTFALQN